ncbi:MAG: PD-(D/E)XK nuclease family protein [Bdellovibrionales bacterium]|nr:PD-(D/E)XK nuclease family protein [Bdellovibrionales bacterium]
MALDDEGSKTANIHRHFVGWNEPLLPAAARWLVKYGRKDGVCWLKDLLCVLPGKRAIRRLRELITEIAEQEGIHVVPPHCITVGAVPEILAGSATEVLSPMESEEIWRKVLSRNTTVVKAIRSSEIENGSIAKELAALRELLGSEGLTFSTALDRLLSSPEVFVDEDRWRALVHLEAEFLAALKELDLCDRTTHRLSLLREASWPKRFEAVALVGTVDSPGIPHRFLEKFEGETHLLLPLSEEHSNGIGVWGTLVPSYWLEHHDRMGLPNIQWHSTLSPEVEASCIAREIDSELALGRSPQELTVAFADEGELPVVCETFRACEIFFHSFKGVDSLYATFASWCRKLAIFVQHGTFDSFVELLKNEWTSDVFHSLEGFDSFYELEHLGTSACFFRTFPLDLSQMPKLPSPAVELLQEGAALYQKFSGKLSPLDCIQRVQELFYEQENLHSEKQTLLVTVLRSYGDQFKATSNISVFGKTFAGEHLAELAKAAELAGVGMRHDEEVSVEFLGWLETLFDDAPVLIVAGFHDQAVPAVSRESAWLPGAVRKLLNLEPAEQKFARDYFYALHAISSREHVRFSFSQTSLNGDFQKPSRLLFGGDNASLLDTAKRSFIDPPVMERVKLVSEPFGNAPDPWILANPFKGSETGPDALSVTSFRDYLACPFRFYLRHVLKLEAQNGIREELDPLLFGNLFHEVVASFGSSTFRDSDDSSLISNFLSNELERQVMRLLGGRSKPPVSVQLLNLEERLHSFASAQAEWRKQGWAIKEVEWSFSKQRIALSHDAGSTTVLGRIDRIDYHEQMDSWIALDYKTSAKRVAPDAAHRSADGWMDLQLPLYRYALESVGKGSNILAGYIACPAKAEEVSFLEARWSDEMFAEAIEVARSVSCSVRRAEFWPPSQDIHPLDDFRDLLGYGQYGALVGQEESVE